MPSWQRVGPSLLSHGSFLRRILPFFFIWIYLLYSWISVSVTFKWGPGVLSFWRHFIFEIMFMMLLVTNDILPGYWILNSISIFIFFAFETRCYYSNAFWQWKLLYNISRVEASLLVDNLLFSACNLIRAFISKVKHTHTQTQLSHSVSLVS